MILFNISKSELERCVIQKGAYALQSDWAWNPARLTFIQEFQKKNE